MYKTGDKVFAKVKGYPFWPARINKLPDEIKIPKGKYPIFFYGTHEVYFVLAKDIKPYAENKDSLGQISRKRGFNEGLEEIENNPDILLYGVDPDSVEYLQRFYTFHSSSQTNISSHQTEEKLIETKKSKNRQRRQSMGGKQKRKLSPDSIDSISSQSTQNSKIKKSSLNKTMPNKTSESISPPPPPQPTTTAALATSTNTSLLNEEIKLSSNGRPIRASARKFSATKLLTMHDDLSISSFEEDKMIVNNESTTTAGLALSSSNHTSSSPSVTTTAHPSTGNRTRIRQPSTSTTLTNDTHLPLKKRRICSGTSSEEQQQQQQQLQPAIISPSSPPASTIKAKPVLISTSSISTTTLLTTTTAEDDDNNIITTTNVSPIVKKELADSSQSSPPPPPPSPLSLQQTQTKSSSLAPVNNEMMERKKNGTTVIDSPDVVVTSNRSKEAKLESRKAECDSSVSTKMTKKNKKQQKSSKLENEKNHPEDDDTMEARLRLANRDIRASLVIGQENYPACIAALEGIVKKPVKVSILSKTELIDTVKKCRKYRFSPSVKLAAEKAYSYFLELYAKADRNELNLVELEAVKRQIKISRDTLNQNKSTVSSESDHSNMLTTTATTTTPPPTTTTNVFSRSSSTTITSACTTTNAVEVVKFSNKTIPPPLVESPLSVNVNAKIKPVNKLLSTSIKVEPTISSIQSSPKPTTTAAVAAASSSKAPSSLTLRIFNFICETKSREEWEKNNLNYYIADRYDDKSASRRKVVESSSHREGNHHHNHRPPSSLHPQAASAAAVSSSSQSSTSPIANNGKNDSLASLDERIALLMGGRAKR